MARIAGFVTVDPRTLYLDQIVVAPEHWGSGVAKVLLDAARQLSPSGLDLDVNTDNARAIRFYEKCGFSRSGAGVNPISGKPRSPHELAASDGAPVRSDFIKISIVRNLTIGAILYSRSSGTVVRRS